MSNSAKLVAAMHAACGCQVKGATEWLTAAQRNDSLRAAFRVVYGARLPSRQKLGQDLSAWAGKVYGELRLVSIYSTHKKAARYTVETQAESTARENREIERETRQEIVDAEKEQRAIVRALRKSNEAEAKKREAAELAAIGSLSIQVVEPGRPVTTEYETTTRVTSDGRIIETPVMGRDGQPLRKHAPWTAAPEKPAKPAQPRTRVEGMRARYLAYHSGAIPAGGRFSDPGGVVSRNIAREGGDDERTRRLRLRDF